MKSAPLTTIVSKVLCAAAFLLHLGIAHAARPCDSAGRSAICGLDDAEDLIPLAGTKWVIATRFNLSFVPPNTVGPGPLTAIDRVTLETHPLYPAKDGGTDWDRDTYPDCPAPPDLFSSHGLNVRALGRNRFRLYVANHGGRESIEIIDVSASGDRLQSTWRGCVLAPKGLFPNAVVPLPGNGFVFSGNGVSSWRPRQGWTTLRAIKSSNGVELSKDGKWLIVNDTLTRTIHRIPVDGLGEDKSIDVDFLPDNLRWGEDGRLYVTGPRAANAPSIMPCLNQSVCDVGFVVAEINPSTLATDDVVKSDGIKGVFGTATVALQIGRELWIGSSRGDRVLILPAKTK